MLTFIQLCISFIKISFMFIYLFLAVLGLRCCMEAFSSCGEQWLLLVAARAPHCGGFSCWARALGAWVSAVAAHGLGSCDAWA